MTRDLDDMDPIDELASAYLDGEVTAAERARVEADPAIAARVEELRRARDLLAEAPAPPHGLEDEQVGRALEIARAHVPQQGGTVVPFRRRLAPVGGAVAAAAAVLLLYLGLSTTPTTEQAQFSSVGASISGAGGVMSGGDAQVEGDASPPAPVGVAPTTVPTGDEDRGSARSRFLDDSVDLAPLAPTDDDEDLRTSVERQLSTDSPGAELGPTAGPASTTIPLNGGVAACSGTDQSAALLGTSFLLAVLEVTGYHQVLALHTTLDGEPVTAVAYASTDDAEDRVIVVLPDDGCTVARVL